MRRAFAALGLVALVGAAPAASAVTLTEDQRSVWAYAESCTQNHDGSISCSPQFGLADRPIAFAPFDATVTSLIEPGITASQHSTLSPTHMQGSGSATSLAISSIGPFSRSDLFVSFVVDEPTYVTLDGEFVLSTQLSVAPTGFFYSRVELCFQACSTGSVFFAGQGAPLAPPAVFPPGVYPFSFAGLLAPGMYNLSVNAVAGTLDATLAYDFDFVVPEPTPLPLVCAGVALLIGVRLRRRA